MRKAKSSGQRLAKSSDLGQMNGPLLPSSELALMYLRPTLGRFGADFVTTLGQLWDDFEPTLGRLWVDFGPTLGRLWVGFGSTFG